MADFSQPTNAADEGQRNAVVLKVGMVGDARVGKTTLMVKYVENKLDEDYIQTLGVNFLEKTVTLRNNDITFSIWDLGGHREFLSMLPLVVNDARALLFMFDLSRRDTLASIKEWYRQCRGLNRTAHAILGGHEVRHLHHAAAGRTGGDRPGRAALRAGHEGAGSLHVVDGVDQRAQAQARSSSRGRSV